VAGVEPVVVVAGVDPVVVMAGVELVVVVVVVAELVVVGEPGVEPVVVLAGVAPVVAVPGVAPVVVVEVGLQAGTGVQSHICCPDACFPAVLSPPAVVAAPARPGKAGAAVVPQPGYY